MSRAFQKQIQRYNHIGKGLKEQMVIFPAEIAEGFTEPDMMKAKLCKIKAKALQNEMMAGVQTCGALGLFFPGSPVWEVQRKKRLTGKFDKTEFLRESLKIGTMGLVNENAMKLYVRAADIEEEDADDNTTTFKNPIEVKDQERTAGDAATASTPAGGEHGENSEEDEADILDSPTTDQRRTGFATARERGVSGWRTWTPESAEHLMYAQHALFFTSPLATSELTRVLLVCAATTMDSSSRHQTR